jgi:hypothetical protein
MEMLITPTNMEIERHSCCGSKSRNPSKMTLAMLGRERERDVCMCVYVSGGSFQRKMALIILGREKEVRGYSF